MKAKKLTVLDEARRLRRDLSRLVLKTTPVWQRVERVVSLAIQEQQQLRKAR